MKVNLKQDAREDGIKIYWKEINWIAKNLSLEVNKFSVDCMTFSDPVVFYKEIYYGYLDDWFYQCYDKDDFITWWEAD